MSTKLVVGTEECPTKDVAAIVSSHEFLSTLFGKWTDVAIDLEIPTHSLKNWKQKVFLDMSTLKEVLCDMVDTWVQLKGSEAFLDELQKAFEKNNFKSVSEKLEKGFKKATQVVNLKQEQLEKALKILCSEETLAKIIKQEEIFFDFEAEDDLTFPEHAIVLPKENRGCALLLNIHEFRKENRSTFREGSLKDTEELNKGLQKLGFKTFPHPQIQQKAYKNKEDIMKLLKDFLEVCKKENANSVFVFIGSHGCHPNQILTSDSELLDIYKDIVSKFFNTAVEAQHLQGKPKMFLVQACQGFTTRTMSNTGATSNTCSISGSDSDSEEEDNLPPIPKVLLEISNTIMCFATHPGGKSRRKKAGGTYFLQRFMRAMNALIKMGRSYQEILNDVVLMTSEQSREKKNMKQVPHIVPYDMDELYFSV